MAKPLLRLLRRKPPPGPPKPPPGPPKAPPELRCDLLRCDLGSPDSCDSNCSCVLSALRLNDVTGGRLASTRGRPKQCFLFFCFVLFSVVLGVLLVVLVVAFWVVVKVVAKPLLRLLRRKPPRGPPKAPPGPPKTKQNKTATQNYTVGHETPNKCFWFASCMWDTAFLSERRPRGPVEIRGRLAVCGRLLFARLLFAAARCSVGCGFPLVPFARLLFAKARCSGGCGFPLVPFVYAVACCSPACCSRSLAVRGGGANPGEGAW